MKKVMIFLLSVILIFSVVAFFQTRESFEKMLESETKPEPPNALMAKPVIYLYPRSEQVVSIKLNFSGKITCSYPEYKNGWFVRAEPDGTLLNLDDGREYSYLFWEGITPISMEFSEGFVIYRQKIQRIFFKKN